MFCPKCGSEIPSGALFCMNCGCNLKEFLENAFPQKNNVGSDSGEAPQKIKDPLPENLEKEKLGILDKSRDYYLSAKKMVAQNESELALSAIRNSLESYVKQLCRKSAIEFDSRETTLETMINALYESNVVDSRDRDLMHNTRKECNKGSHVDIDGNGPNMEVAMTAMGYLESLFDESSVVSAISQTSQAVEQNNVPMPYPDYLSSKRRFYGKWEDCMTEKQLLTNPDYVELKKKAEEDMDVDAMLNLAMGFLSQNIDWNDNMLINMPGVHYRGDYYVQRQAYNSRYYYWVIRAVSAAYIKWYKGETFSKKYISSAIWETWLAWFYFAFNIFDEEIYPEKYVLGKFIRPEKWKEYYYITGIDTQYDSESKQYINTPIAGNQDVLYGNIGAILNAYIPMNDYPIPDNSFHDFSREFFVNAPDHIVAPIYTGAQDHVVEKIDLMYFLIKTVRSEENWLYPLLKDKAHPSIFRKKKNIEEPQFYKYSDREISILSFDQVQLNCTGGESSEIAPGKNMLIKDLYKLCSEAGVPLTDMYYDVLDRKDRIVSYLGEKFVRKYINSNGLDVNFDMI